MRKIYIVGTIDEEAYLKFSKHLDQLIAQNTKDKIIIELVSEGGNAYDALAFYGKIKACSAWTEIIAHGICHSAATLILSAANDRFVTSEISIMVHQGTASIRGNTSTLVSQSKQELAEEKHWNALLASSTKKPAEFWAKLHKKTTYLTASQALEYGLVDAIKEYK